jgi:hypothetical protein
VHASLAASVALEMLDCGVQNAVFQCLAASVHSGLHCIVYRIQSTECDRSSDPSAVLIAQLKPPAVWHLCV